MTATCPNGHPRTPTNTGHNTRGHRVCRPCARAASRRRWRRRWDKRHADHDVVILSGRHICRTCGRAYAVDEAAVERATAGDPPPRLTPAERAAAIARLKPAMPGTQVAEQVGCTERTVWRILRRTREQVPA